MHDQYRQAVMLSPDFPAEPAAGDGLSLAESSLIVALWRHRGLLLVFLDVVSVASSFMLAYYIRFYAQFLAIKQVPVAGVGLYLKGAGLLAAMWAFFIWRDGGYESGLRGAGAPMLRIRSLLRSGIYAITMLMAISFMWRDMPPSRQVYLMTGVIACGTTVFVRLLFRSVDCDLAAQGVVIQRVVVIGMNERAQEFAERLQADACTIRIVGFMLLNSHDQRDVPVGKPILGTLDDIRTIHQKVPFHTLVLSSLEQAKVNSRADKKKIIEVINFCEEKHISLYMLPGSFDVAVAQHEVASLSGVPMIQLQDASLHPAYAVIKRVMDVFLSSAGLIVGMPIWLLIALLIKLTSEGPVIFAQNRAGLHGR
ncbi:MAG: sugar transferase, partial [Candidatus Hydrogenedentota bacterium]